GGEGGGGGGGRRRSGGGGGGRGPGGRRLLRGGGRGRSGGAGRGGQPPDPADQEQRPAAPDRGELAHRGRAAPAAGQRGQQLVGQPVNGRDHRTALRRLATSRATRPRTCLIRAYRSGQYTEGLPKPAPARYRCASSPPPQNRRTGQLRQATGNSPAPAPATPPGRAGANGPPTRTRSNGSRETCSPVRAAPATVAASRSDRSIAPSVCTTTVGTGSRPTPSTSECPPRSSAISESKSRTDVSRRS